MQIRTKTIFYQETIYSAYRFTLVFNINTEDNTIISIKCADSMYHISTTLSKTAADFVIPDTLSTQEHPYYPVITFIKAIKAMLEMKNNEFFDLNSYICDHTTTVTTDTITRDVHLSIQPLAHHDDSWYDA